MQLLVYRGHAMHTWVLINVWVECPVLYEFGWISRNVHMHWKISWRLEQVAIQRTPSQCWKCMKRLRFLYRKVKDYNSWSGKTCLTCPFCEELDWVLARALSAEPEVAS